MWGEPWNLVRQRVSPSSCIPQQEANPAPFGSKLSARPRPGTFLVLETGDQLSTAKLSLLLVNTYEQSSPTLEITVVVFLAKIIFLSINPLIC